MPNLNGDSATKAWGKRELLFCMLLLVAFSTALNLQFNQPPLERFPNWDSFWTDTMTVGGLGGLKNALSGGHLPAINPYINFGWNFAGDTTVVEQYADPFNWLVFALPPTSVVVFRTISIFFIGSVGAFLWLRMVTGGLFVPLIGAMAYVSLPVLYTLTYGSILTTWIFFAPLLLFLLELDRREPSAKSSGIFALVSLLTVSCGNVYTLIALPLALATYSFFASDAALSMSGVVKRIRIAFRVGLIFVGAGGVYVIPFLHNVIERGDILKRFLALGYHVVQRGDAMVAVPGAVDSGGNQLGFMAQFIGSLLPSALRPIDNGLMLYVPAFCIVFAVGYGLLRTCPGAKKWQLFGVLAAVCLVLFSETFIFYVLPDALTRNSTGRLRGQIALIPFLILLASMVAISDFGKAIFSGEARRNRKWNLRLFAVLLLVGLAWDCWQFIFRGNLDIYPFIGRHHVISPFPSSNAISIRWWKDMWPALPISNLALLTIVAIGAFFDRRRYYRAIYLFGIIGSIIVIFQVSLLNELRTQQGEWAWSSRNDFRLRGFKLRYACLRKFANLSNPNYRALVASKPVFHVVGNVKIATGRNWKLIAETELPAADRVNVLWPYRNTVDPFTAVVFSSIAGDDQIQLNNLMPAITDMAVKHLDVVRAVGAKWLISADERISNPRLSYVGTCSSPNNPGYDRQEMQGGSLFLYRIANPLGISYRTSSYRVVGVNQAWEHVINREWAKRPGLAFVDDQNSKAALASLANLHSNKNPVKHVRVDSMTFDRVVLSSAAGEPGLVVLTMAYRPYWHAKVNGKPVPILRIFGGFLGVVVPKGEAHVVFYYSPYDLYLGFLLSMVTVAIAFRWRRGGYER